MSGLPSCPTCSTPVPLREDLSTTVRRPLSKSCASCGEGYPPSILPNTPDTEDRRAERLSYIKRKLTGE